MNCEYVKKHYGVQADIGRKVICNGESGIIAEDRGHYIGVNFDKDKPCVVHNVHPTDNVEYLEMGKIRKATRSQLRYKRYLEYGDCFEQFIDFLRWDGDKERSWNN